MAVASQRTSEGRVHVLIFEQDDQLYGVDVGQVETIVGGQVSLGEEAEGVWVYGGQEVPIRDLARWIGLERRGAGPGRVLLSRSSGTLRGFLVDTPKDIVGLPLENIHPIPDLIRRVLGPSPLWGVGRGAQGLILLVDLAHRRELGED